MEARSDSQEGFWPVKLLLFIVVMAATVNAETNGVFTAQQQINLTAFSYESILTSPYYPVPYPVFCSRTYLIKASSADYIVRIEIVDLDVEYDSVCRNNSLDIYDGDSVLSPRLAHLCGYLQTDADRPRYIFSHGRNLFLTFTTDAGNRPGRYKGFEIRFSAQPGTLAPGTRSTSTPFSLTRPAIELEARLYIPQYLTSPGYPSYYPKNYVQRWLIKAADSYFLKVTINDLQIQYHPSCSLDNLTIYDASVPNPSYLIQIAQLCSPAPSASLSSGDYYSSGSYLYLVFRTDSMGEGRGFKIGYQAIFHAGPSQGDMTACVNSNTGGLKLQVSMGTAQYIASPGYPRSYQNNLDCGWLIMAPYGYVVHVHVLAMDLESSGSCQFDSVTLYDATWANSFNTIDRLCTVSGTDYYSRDNHMFVVFKTDGSRANTGFRLVYQAVQHSDRPAPGNDDDDDTTDADAGTGRGSGSSPAHVGGAVAGVVVSVLAITTITICIVVIRRRTRQLGRPTSGRVSFTQASGQGPWTDPRGCHAARNPAFDPYPPTYTDLYPDPADYASLGVSQASDHLYVPLPPPTYEEVLRVAKAGEPAADVPAPAVAAGAAAAGYLSLAAAEPSAPSSVSV